MSELNRINKGLRRFGINPQGEPLFRIVWSDTQTELRKGTFEEWKGSLYLRTVIGLKERKKYPYIRERWILERWISPALAYTEEIPGTKQGSYEPLYVFQSEDGQYLPLNVHFLNEVINCSLKPLSMAESMARMEAQQEIAERRQLSVDFDKIQDSGLAFEGRKELGTLYINPGTESLIKGDVNADAAPITT